MTEKLNYEKYYAGLLRFQLLQGELKEEERLLPFAA